MRVKPVALFTDVITSARVYYIYHTYSNDVDALFLNQQTNVGAAVKICRNWVHSTVGQGTWLAVNYRKLQALPIISIIKANNEGNQW